MNGVIKNLDFRSQFFYESILPLGILLVLLQVLDAVLTFQGLTVLGVSGEGNPLLAGLMETYGVATVLASVKSIASLLILALCLVASKIRWVFFALKILSLLYVFAAILPWTYILLFIFK
jgi:Domain of unknown function (DUF5658)